MCEVAFHHYEVQRDDEGGSARPKVELEGDVAERCAKPLLSTYSLLLAHGLRASDGVA